MDSGSRLAEALGFLPARPLLPERDGFRQLALQAMAHLHLRRARLLAEGALLLPLPLIEARLAPLVGQSPGEAYLPLAEEVEAFLLRLPSPPRFPKPYETWAVRPWRALLLAAYGVKDPSRRERLFRYVLGLDGAGAWVGFTYLRLALPALGEEETVARLEPILDALLFMARRRALWEPWRGLERDSGEGPP